MMPILRKAKSIDPNRIYDEPQLLTIPVYPRRQNYDFEIISGTVWDSNGNEYLTKEQALKKGVSEKDIISEEDFMDEHVCLAYRYEKSFKDQISLINAKKAGFGVIRMLTGDVVGVEFMFSLYKTTRALNLVVYSFLTHNFVDKELLKELKKDEKLQNELKFITGLSGDSNLFDAIMNY